MLRTLGHSHTLALRFLIFAALAALPLVAACSDDDDDDDSAASPTGEAEAHDEEVHWAYEGEAGPENWGSLSVKFALCADGTMQSPIELAVAVREDIPDLSFDYHESPLAIYNNGHTIQAAYAPGSSVTIGDKTYDLVQFHFHAHSEHTIGGETYPMEMHLVHRAADQSLAVVGVFLEEGEANPAYDAIFANLPTAESEEAEAVEGVTVDAAALLPEDHTYFAYDGSLTTPECTEGVEWNVLTQPVQVSAEQIAAFTAIHDGNYRPVQPLGDRDVLLDE
jgi:carbonic anhydrase